MEFISAGFSGVGDGGAGHLPVLHAIGVLNDGSLGNFCCPQHQPRRTGTIYHGGQVHEIRSVDNVEIGIAGNAVGYKVADRTARSHQNARNREGNSGEVHAGHG